MALGDERRASGRRMEAQRKAIGAAVRASRQSTFKQDLNALETSPRRQGSLRAVEPIGARPAVMGKSYYTPPPATGGGGGIASPLTEPNVAAREYWPERLVPSSDGLSWLRWKPLKKIVMQDANGEPVILEFKDVPAV